jgi:maltokinase
VRAEALAAVEAYVAAARWFGGKGRDASATAVRRVALLPQASPEGPQVGIELVDVTYAGAETETYQLPLAYYPQAQERLEHALVGSWHDDDLGDVVAYDAAHDREAAALFLQGFADEARTGDLTFFRLPGHELDTDTHSTLFSGEQSNSSLAFGDDSLMKLFRKVTAGRNPDIEIHRALTERGSEHVAALYGWLELAGDPDDPDAEPVQLAMLQQFLRTASDGWQIALASVRDLFAEADLHADEVGGDFAGEAERLGLATAQVHDVLAAEFPTRSWGAEDLAALSRAMLARLDAATQVVPQLAEHHALLRETFRSVAEVGEDATAQRVHGDFHLGQTLRTVKGWKLVDFEGEPARPLADRIEPDLVWRDVAGMLRSFDYAAHAVAPDFAADPDTNRQIAFRAAEWADRNQAAFLRGYTENSGRTAGGGLTDHQDLVLRAYVADKAVYEAVYEARNRPTWLPIPLAAIARLGESRTTSPDPLPPGTTSSSPAPHTDPGPDARPGQEAPR